MNKYTGWVNEVLDQFKPFENELNQTLKQKKILNPKQASLIQMLQRLMRLGNKSVKFKLPLDALLFDVDPDKSILDTINTFIGTELNLPFNEIALEFPVEYTNGVISPFIVFAEQVEDEIELLVFNKSKNNKWTSIRGLHLSINRFNYDTTCVFIDKDQIMEGDPNDTLLMEQTETITQIAVSAVMQLLCALSCSNVNISDDDIKPSAVKQTIRSNKGKLPLFTYKILTVQIGRSPTDTIKLSANSTTQPNEDYTPSNKRAHLRRGHPRKYKSGLKIWVNACSVGNKQFGEIEKTYNIKP